LSSGNLPQKVIEEISDLFYTYQGTGEHVKALQKERSAIIAKLMPRVGASLVKLRPPGGEVQDPTGKAAVNLAEHPLVVRIDREIDFWQQRKAKVDQLLPFLTDREREIFELCYHRLPPSEEWPKVGPGEIRRTRRAILEKAARLGLGR